MRVIGIGTHSGSQVEDVILAIAEAERLSGQRCDTLASLVRGDLDAAIVNAAKQTGHTVLFFDQAELGRRSLDCVTQSDASMSAHGIPSVAEAAALTGAGASSRLEMPRRTYSGVTIAVAVSVEMAGKGAQR